ncbi:MAG: DUF5000 domain-containing lipoprotein [Mangrovibacterium sp.]
MKRLIYTLIIFNLLLHASSCKEEPIGQYPTDKIPPKPVENVTVENFPGGATISYDIPEEEDLLYVKIPYQLPNGKMRTNKSSVFENQITIKGFGKSKKEKIALISVDRSQNESEPYYVDIEPEDNPIFSIHSNMVIQEAFGGLKLFWENPLKEEIMVGILRKNELGELQYVDNFYSSVVDAAAAVRGLDSVKTTFGIYVRDAYENYTDTSLMDLKPLYEQQLDKALFKSMGQPSIFNYVTSTTGVGPMPRIWDNIYNYPVLNLFYISPGGTIKPYFTFDMGVVAKLSRFRFWGRRDYLFSLHNPKFFEVWGTNDRDVAADGMTQGWENNPAWIKLLDGESKRPSGGQLGDPLTDEDIAYAEAGEEYEFPLNVPPVRYIRYRSLISWSGSLGLHVNEIDFWGQVEK